MFTRHFRVLFSSVASSWYLFSKLQGHGMSICESVSDATLATVAVVICGVHGNLVDNANVIDMALSFCHNVFMKKQALVKQHL